ncbi:MAG TPA: hypothetical protein VIA45_06320 [Thermoanaerobaculia bacterium]
MVRTVSLCAAALAVAAAAFAAAAPNRYRIELTNGSEVVSADRPTPRGTIVIFHRASDGALDGVPAEMVARIEPGTPGPRGRVLPAAAAARTPGEALEPGEVVDLGTIDDAYVTPRADTGTAPSAAPGPQTPAVWNGFYYGIGGGPARNPSPASGALLASVPSSTDLVFAQTSGGGNTPSLVGSNGFPAVPGAPATVIGPDGTPVLSPAAAAPAIGPNGTPVLDASAATPNIGSNGTPILAPPGTPGATPLPIGPNGTPILAPAGSPGSVSPTIDANGTPAVAPATFPTAAGAAAMTAAGATAMTVSGAAAAPGMPAAAPVVAKPSGVAPHR